VNDGGLDIDLDLGLDAAPRRDGQIKRHARADFEGMRQAGRLAASALDMLVEHVRPGVTTQVLDDLVREYFLQHGARPATLFYKGYTKSSCTSINHVVCHGIPNEKPLKDGDIVISMSPASLTAGMATPAGCSRWAMCAARPSAWWK